MPGGIRIIRRRRRKFKHTFSRQNNKIKALARREAKKVFNKRVEMKNHTLAQAATGVGAGAALTYSPLTNIAQGDSYATRDGGEINVKAIKFNYQMVCADSTNYIRLVVFQWFNGATNPTTNDVLEFAGTYSGLAAYNPHSEFKYKVLHSEIRQMVLGTESNTLLGSVNLSFPNGIKCEYNGSSSTDYANSQIWLLAISDSGAISHPTLEYVGNVYFQDA